MSPVLDCVHKQLDLTIPQVMGVLNVTPDSFSDGGCYLDPQKALAQAKKMVLEGASIIDIGGESTRPGAQAVTIEEEIQRTIPIIKTVKDNLDVVISIDTSKPEVMVAAVEAGATIINDVFALQANGALETAYKLKVAVCLMHMRGEPRTMQTDPHYDNLVVEVKQFLQARINKCLDMGFAANKLIVDPGFGFGKTVRHNLLIIKHLEEFTALGVPLLIGVSRKSTIGTILDKPVAERLYGSLALAGISLWLGAKIVRTHDVGATMDTLKLCHAVMNEN